MPRTGYEDVVLITGFPEVGARRLCAHLLAAEPQTFVYLVVLEKLLPQAAAVLESFPEAERRRVGVLAGDVAAIDLGLSGSEYRTLAREVGRIHHAAHVSYLGIDRQTAEYANVGGAAEVIELAKNAEALRCVVHHSTAHVSGDRKGTIYEEELDCGQGFHDFVQASRFKAEKLMRRAMRDLPIAIVRPTMMVGDSGTGEADRLDGPYLLVLLILGFPGEGAFPLPSGGDRPLDIVPVDYVAKAAHAIGRSPEGPGRTYHLASCEQLTAGQVFETIAQAGGRRTVKSHMPPELVNALLHAPGVDRLMRSPRALVQQLVSGARYDRRNAEAILHGTGIECPKLADYVDTLVARAVDEFGLRRRDGSGASESAR
ncbi:MAG: SDR family oxidoreductase [Polyangiaceae bacterium]|nr:SDR family oxidoreductase [Polyangiaceae bacterium]